MKTIIYLFIAIFTAGVYANAQMPPANLPDAQLTKEQAEYRIKDFQARVADLENTLNEEKTKLERAQNQLRNTNKNLEDCLDELKKMLGVTDKDIEAFRQKLGIIAGKVRELKALNDDALADRQDEVIDLENQLNELRKEKIALLPEFYNRILELAREIKGLYREKRISTYIVKSWSKERDCLWNIANRTEIYGDAFLWPKIWQANKDIIRNPDIIHPGQELKLPEKSPKSGEELKAERKYYRLKKEAEAETETATAGE